MSISGIINVRAGNGKIGVPSALLRVYSDLTRETWNLSQGRPDIFRFWQPYIRKHQRLVVESLGGFRQSKRLSLCIVGVENGFDIPWNHLEEMAESRIRRIVLVDLDKGCMERRRDTLSPSLRKKIEIMRADASLVICRALSAVLDQTSFSSGREAGKEFMERCSGAKDPLPFIDGEFDLVLSTQVMNQLLYQPLSFIRQKYGYEGELIELAGDREKAKETERELQLGHIRELFRLADVGGRVLISHIPSERKVGNLKVGNFKQTVTVDGRTFWATEELRHCAGLGELLSGLDSSIRMRALHPLKRWGWLKMPPLEKSEVGVFLKVEGTTLEKI